MEVTKQKVGPCAYTLRIMVDKADVDRAFRKAWKEFAEVTAVPGFRPGKAPRAILEKYVDEERLRSRVMRSLAADALTDALTQEELDILVDPDIKPGDLVQGEPWEFEARVIVRPVVNLPDMTSVEIRRPVFVVEESDIDSTLQRLRETHAIEEPVQDRGVAEGDIVYVMRRIHVDGEEPEEETPDRFIIGKSLPELDKGMLGQQLNETRSIHVQFPPNFHLSRLAGKAARVDVTVTSITRSVLPEVTDEWIRQIGAGESVEDFRAREREHLQQQFDEVSERTARSRAVDELVQRAEVEYPEVLLQQEAQEDLDELAAELSRNEMTYEDYLKSAGMTKEEHIASVEKEADRRLRTRLVLREFARQHSIQLTQEEIEAVTDVSARIVEAGAGPEGVTAAEHARSLLNRTLFEKIGNRLMEMVRVVDEPVSQSEQS